MQTLTPRGSLASIINFTQIPKARRMQLTKDMNFLYDMSQKSQTTTDVSPELFSQSLFPHKQQEHHFPLAFAIYHP